MKVQPKAAVGILMGWCLIIFFVTLLTVIFSFVGTLICAGLAGMMMGAARLPRWQSLALSLVFPGVILGALRATRAELAGRQVLLVALLCFGLYWVIFAAIAALVSQERRAAARQEVDRRPAPAIHPQEDASGQVRGEVLRKTAEPGAGKAAEDEAWRCALKALQGTWVPESAADGVPQTKVLQIKEESLVLSLRNGDGQVRLAKANLKRSCGSEFNIQAAGWIPGMAANFQAAGI